MKKRLKFLPEYFTTCIWICDENDVFFPIKEYALLRLPEELIQKLKAFDLEVMNVIDWSHPSGPSPLSYEERQSLYTYGIYLCNQVKECVAETYEIIQACDWLKP